MSGSRLGAAAVMLLLFSGAVAMRGLQHRDEVPGPVSPARIHDSPPQAAERLPQPAVAAVPGLEVNTVQVSPPPGGAAPKSRIVSIWLDAPSMVRVGESCEVQVYCQFADGQPAESFPLILEWDSAAIQVLEKGDEWQVSGTAGAYAVEAFVGLCMLDKVPEAPLPVVDAEGSVLLHEAVIEIRHLPASGEVNLQLWTEEEIRERWVRRKGQPQVPLKAIRAQGSDGSEGERQATLQVVKHYR